MVRVKGNGSRVHPMVKVKVTLTPTQWTICVFWYLTFFPMGIAYHWYARRKNIEYLTMLEKDSRNVKKKDTQAQYSNRR
jgi:hypothetical protein